MKTTKGMMGLVCSVIFVFCGSVFVAEPATVSAENGMEGEMRELDKQGLTVAPLAFEGTSNTLFGTEAGHSLAADDRAATFVGYQAGYNTNGTTGDEGRVNTFVGYRSGYMNTTGSSNTFLGSMSGLANTTGKWNTFLGTFAGYQNTEGQDNTFVGLSAGFNNTTGADNTFLGDSSGVNNTTGNENTFLGDSAGHSNTTGSSNTFLGSSAGYLSTTSTGNSFFGRWAGCTNSTGNYNSFFGYQTGNNNTTGYFNTFLGVEAGYTNSNGVANVHIGRQAGYNSNGSGNVYIGHMTGHSNTTGWRNTVVGEFAGGNSATGADNVFLGWSAGQNETGSKRLYIDVTNTSTPLIYGQFDNRRLTINGNLEVIGPNNGLVRLSNVTTNNTTKVSRMVLNHYTNTQLPLYLFGAASTSGANFVAFGGGNTMGNAATQLDLFTAPNTTTPVGIPRLTIIGNGNVGIGTQTPAQPLQMASGAHVTAGGVWTNASSREYKDQIETLTHEEAFDTLRGLNPVKFAYKTDKTEKHVGFVAEEVPNLVATKDRKGLSSMDIVAVLTKVVQEQQKTNQEQQTVIKTLTEKLAQLEAKMEGLQARGIPFPILSQK